MSRFPVLRHLRFRLLALALGVVTAMLVLMSPPPAAAFICAPDQYQSHNVFYYSGPNHQTQVGEYHGCSGTFTGKEQTVYFISVPVCCAPV